MKGTVLITTLVVVSACSQAQYELFDNAAGRGLGWHGLATMPRPSGGYYSEVTSPNTTFGFIANENLALADDFTTGPGPWSVTEVQTYGYQEDANAMDHTIDGGIWRILGDNAGAPDETNVIATTTIWGGNGMTFVNRATTGGASGDTRQIQYIYGHFDAVPLEANSKYWLSFQHMSSFFPGSCFTPPLTAAAEIQPPGSTNAQQFNGSVWTPITDKGSGAAQDLPFIVTGFVVPEPSTIAVLGIGAAALLTRRLRSRRARR